MIGSWVGKSTGAGESRDANGKLSTCLSHYPSAHLSFLPSFHLSLVLMHFSFLSSLLPCLLSVCLPSFSSFFRFLSLLLSTCLLVSASRSVNHSGCRFTCLPIYGSYLPCFAPLFLCLPNCQPPFQAFNIIQSTYPSLALRSLFFSNSLPLSLYLSHYLPIHAGPCYLYIHVSINLPVCLSASLSACLPVRLSVYQSINCNLPIYLLVNLPAYFSASLSIPPSFPPST